MSLSFLSSIIVRFARVIKRICAFPAKPRENTSDRSSREGKPQETGDNNRTWWRGKENFRSMSLPLSLPLAAGDHATFALVKLLAPRALLAMLIFEQSRISVLSSQILMNLPLLSSRESLANLPKNVKDAVSSREDMLMLPRLIAQRSFFLAFPYLARRPPERKVAAWCLPFRDCWSKRK